MTNEVIQEYLERSSWRVSENANHNESFSNLSNYISNKVLAKDFLDALSPELRNAHKEGILHIHNLEAGGYIPYCCGHNLKLVLLKGMLTPSINSRPAKHLNSVMDHVMNWLYCSQMEFAGAQSFGDFDTLVAPFIKKDKLDYKEVKQQVQKLVYNLNFTMRSSSQTPFTNLTLNYSVPKFLEDQNAIVGGEEQSFTYSDCIEEIAMIDRAFSEIMNERDPNGKPFTFPILTVNINQKFPWDSEESRILALNCANLGSYYFMNYLGSGIDEDIMRSMCCRLMLKLEQFNGPKGMWNTAEGTGSLGVVTLNLPRLGYDCKGKNEKTLFEELESRLNYALAILQIRKNRIINNYKRLMPFNYMNKWSIKNYFMTIGILGMNEMCLNYLGMSILEDDAISFVQKVILYIKEWTIIKQKEFKELINIEMVPGEGSSYRLASVDRKLNNGIKTLGTDSAPYYSTLLVPPLYETDVFDRLSLEEKILPIFSGGTIFRTYLGETTPRSETILEFLKILAKSKIPYFDITSTYSVCTNDGKLFRGSVPECESCKSETEVYSRVVGYYRPVSRWNIGKIKEFHDRKYTNLVLSKQ